jgi:phosphate-selective porin
MSSRLALVLLAFATSLVASEARALDWDRPGDADAGPALAPNDVAVDAGASVLPNPAAAASISAAHSNAGHAAGWFYLRSDDDNFILMPSGRLQMDFYGYQGGVNAPVNTFFPKRARLEAFGTIMKHWDFQLGSEFTNSTTPIATDIFLNANYSPFANVQVGQFDAPFTMENRTSDKWTDLQERARTVAALGIPENKEIGLMVWGQPIGKWAYWSGGVFNGEGLDNLKHTSNNFDLMARGWFAPFGLMDVDLLRWLWIGGSVWHGDRVSSPTNQVDRIAMTDQARYTFWNPVQGAVHAGDQGDIDKWAIEFNVPVSAVVLKGEVVNDVENLRELDESVASKPVAIRNGLLTGMGYYLRASFFVWGDTLINGLAGTQNPPHLFGALAPDRTDDALQLVVNAEHLSWSYTSTTYRTAPASEPADALVGNFGASFFGAGANYWYTKNIRLTGNFMYDVFEGPGPRPLAHGNTAYEMTFRAALVL